ncbi:MAG TPA: hypothetical protein VNS58_08815 [Puia sp.]|nr:hypothetical protein [Puia sp.]
MKYPVFLLLLMLGFSAHPMAQSADSAKIRSTDTVAGNSLSSLKPVTIQLDFPKEPSSSRFASLFHHFEVLDERPDTARIGVHAVAVGPWRSRNRQLLFSRPASSEIAAYLDARFARPGEAYAALVVIRTLWLSDANNMREDLLREPEKYDEKTKIRLKAEVYAEKDGQYIPLYRFDSVQIFEKNSLTRLGKELSGMLEGLADSATLLLAQKGGSGRKIDRPAILQFNRSRFDPPISKDSSLVKGVYNTFEEFKDNTPSVQDFEIKREKGNLILYLKEAGGHSYYSHNAWGYCDGKNVYIMKDGMLTPAWKEGKAWYLFSQVQIIDPKRQGGSVGGPGFTTPSPGGATTTGPYMTTSGGNETQLHILTVDMDTGKLY